VKETFDAVIGRFAVAIGAIDDDARGEFVADVEAFAVVFETCASRVQYAT
jgi:hypothetical protein